MLEKMLWTDPSEIEKRSMEMIESEMPAGSWTPAERLVVKRCIHTSADFDYAKNLYFSPGAAEQALTVMARGGFTLVCDTNMGLSGISKPALSSLGGTAVCFMADREVAAEARSRGVTRAVVSMERSARLAGPLIFAVGNAPTALIRLGELIESGQLRPALIIGVPVGFVNVVEAKEWIRELGVPCIVARGRKGGSGIAAAIVNSLLYQLYER